MNGLKIFIDCFWGYSVFWIVGAYLLGSINPSIIIGRLRGVDIRSRGSGNAGTTNTLRTMGKGIAAIVFIFDIAKGFIPAFFAGLNYGESACLEAGFIVGLFAIVGHMWPVFFGFKGGKGVATAFGVLLAVDWVLALIMIAIVIVTVAVCRYVSLGTLIACVCAAPVSLLTSGDREWPFLLVLAALIIFKHRGNIKRLVKHEESKISFRKKDS